MKIHIELWGYKNKTLIERNFTIDEAYYLDFPQEVDKMINATKDAKMNLRSKPIPELLNELGCDECKRPLSACKCD